MNQRYYIRTLCVFFIFITLFSVIIGALYFIQIQNRDFFINLGSQQYCVKVKQNPPRGIIYDRNKKPLALNHEGVAAFILPNKLEDKEKLYVFLQKHFPGAFNRLQAAPHANFMYIKRKLTECDLETMNKAALPDIKFLYEPSRYYPFKAAGPVVGITDVDNNGLFGIEYMYNTQLTGSPALYCLEKEARSNRFYFKKDIKKEATCPQDIHLTIDSDIQFLAYQELKKTVHAFNAQEGAVLVINPSNGHILAMVSYPTFQPNNVVDLDLEKTKNKIFTQAYELGSVMKAFAALALLQEQLVTADELIDCENSTTSIINGARFTTLRPHGAIPFSQVIQLSNNIGIAKTAQRLGSLLYDHYMRLGFGKKVTLDWPGQQAGFVNHPSKWSRSSLTSLSFGYEIRATLIQLAQAFCMVINNGSFVPFQLLHNDESHVSQATRLYSQQAIEQLWLILEKNVAKPIAGYTIRGKTGTANMVIDGHYSPEHNIYTFEGAIIKDDYKRVIITFVKDAQRKDLRAALVAAPLFDAIVHDLLLHEKIHAQGKNNHDRE